MRALLVRAPTLIHNTLAARAVGRIAGFPGEFPLFLMKFMKFQIFG
jgi:hypothetical protein